jgi:lipopolysaccharide export system permease protein
MKNVKVDSGKSEGDVFHNFHIFVVGDPIKGDAGAYIHADTAETVVDDEKKQIRLRLTGAYADGEERPGKEFTMLSDDLEWIAIDYSDEGRRKPKPTAMTNPQIDEFLLSRPDLPEKYRRRYEAEQTRRYTSSLACLAFALVGVPLGIKARRRDTSTGRVLSLAIGALYFMAGSVLGDSEGATWVLWIPNIACMGLGIILFRRARFR